MRNHLFVVISLGALAACTSGPSKDQSLKAFAAATTAMATAQSSAVADARTHASAAPGTDLALNYNGPCTLGGTVGVTGSYDSSGTGDQAVFDLSTTFASCATPTGTLDGSMTWHSEASGSAFSETMSGNLSYTGGNDSFSCDFNLSLSVDATGVTYAGTVCGYDVQADLHVQHP